eukprot:365375-Chlamydomonas_euryale.AAC.7
MASSWDERHTSRFHALTVVTTNGRSRERGFDDLGYPTSGRKHWESSQISGYFRYPSSKAPMAVQSSFFGSTSAAPARSGLDAPACQNGPPGTLRESSTSLWCNRARRRDALASQCGVLHASSERSIRSIWQPSAVRAEAQLCHVPTGLGRRRRAECSIQSGQSPPAVHAAAWRCHGPTGRGQRLCLSAGYCTQSSARSIQSSRSPSAVCTQARHYRGRAARGRCRPAPGCTLAVCEDARHRRPCTRRSTPSDVHHARGAAAGRPGQRADQDRHRKRQLASPAGRRAHL